MPQALTGGIGVTAISFKTVTRIPPHPKDLKGPIFFFPQVISFCQNDAIDSKNL
jgi:hypothetical protein